MKKYFLIIPLFFLPLVSSARPIMSVPNCPETALTWTIHAFGSETSDYCDNLSITGMEIPDEATDPLAFVEFRDVYGELVSTIPFPINKYIESNSLIPDLSGSVGAITGSTQTTLGSMRVIVYAIIGLLVTFWLISQIVGLFPKNKKHYVKPQKYGKTIVLGD